ncbi:hypothetical protein SDC9_148816 [bioreactor metagenome]|uniref:Uncharacterized protein n=1 Tax=bioreactor metagenome TaxID=1076179 RepID=A0A645EJI1_9ZZZZ
MLPPLFSYQFYAHHHENQRKYDLTITGLKHSKNIFMIVNIQITAQRKYYSEAKKAHPHLSSSESLYVHANYKKEFSHACLLSIATAKHG